MKTKLYIPIIAVLLASLFGCTTPYAGYRDITDVSQRIELIGLSVLPPQEDGWKYRRDSAIYTTFGKEGTQEAQSIIGLVALYKIPDITSEEEFIKVSSDLLGLGSGDPRYEDAIDDLVYSTEKNTPSVRYHSKYKDLGAINLPKGTAHLMTEDIGIFCKHPDNPSIGVNIVLSQRSLPGDTVENFKELADEFIKNAEFSQLPD